MSKDAVIGGLHAEGAQGQRRTRDGVCPRQTQARHKLGKGLACSCNRQPSSISNVATCTGIVVEKRAETRVVRRWCRNEFRFKQSIG